MTWATVGSVNKATYQESRKHIPDDKINVSTLRNDKGESLLADTLHLNDIKPESGTSENSVDGSSLKVARNTLEDWMKIVEIQLVAMKETIEDNRKELKHMIVENGKKIATLDENFKDLCKKVKKE